MNTETGIGRSDGRGRYLFLIGILWFLIGGPVGHSLSAPGLVSSFLAILRKRTRVGLPDNALEVCKASTLLRNMMLRFPAEA